LDYTFHTRIRRVLRDFKKHYKVHEIEITDTEETYLVTGGTQDYTVKLIFDEEERLKEWSCTCPDFTTKTHGYCKHIIGVLYHTGREFMILPKLIEEIKG